jgi:PKD domain/Bacterial Ig-like domain
MRRRALLFAVLASFVVPAAAHAATRTVDQTVGPYTTITDALQAAAPGDTIDIHQGHYDEQLSVDKDDLTLHAAPSTVVSSTAPWTISLTGAGDTLQGLSVTGGSGGVRITGNGASLVNMTVLADTTGVSVEGPVNMHLLRSFVHATGLAGTALMGRNDAPASEGIDVRSSVIVGGPTGTGIDVLAGAVDDTARVGAATLSVGFCTIVGAPVAIRSKSVGMSIFVFQQLSPADSIIHGVIDGLVIGYFHSDTTTPDDQLFVNASAFDFHLRADAPAIDAVPSDSALPGETDLDGNPRISGAAADQGAFEFVDHAPTAVLSTPTATAKLNAPVTLDASASSDPDPGGRIVAYNWAFGDGTTAQTTTPITTHAYAKAGSPSATVQTVDQQGSATSSAPLVLSITKPDLLGPSLRITSPADHARLHRYRTIRRKHRKTRHTVNVVRFAGRVTDASGVASVKLALVRKRAKGAKAPVPISADATLHGKTWSWHSPAHAPLPAGSYTLTARAADRAGNVSTPSVLHFTVT